MLARAWRDYAAFARGHRPQIIGGLLLYAVGSIIYGFVEGWQKVMDEALIFACFTVLPVVGFAVLGFVWSLWLAPMRIVLSNVEAIRSALPEASSREGPVEPNFDVWVRLETAMIVEIAALCANEDPHRGKMSGRQIPYQSLIYEGVKNEQIRRADGEERPIRTRRYAGDVPETKILYSPLTSYSPVHIADVCAFLKARGLEPEFCRLHANANPQSA